MKRVLLIEDDESIRLMVNEIVKAKNPGFDVITVSTAEEGLKLVKQDDNIVVVLLDLKLDSVMQGRDFLDVLKKLKLKVSVIPATASSPSVKDELVKKYPRLVKDVLFKPYDGDELISIVNKTLIDLVSKVKK